MRILVVNGSPKGETSITLQTLLYLKKRFPEHQWSCLHAGRFIAKIEKDPAEAEAKLAAADCVLFAYPVYTFFAPSQLHRFIRLMKERGVSLAGKTVSQVTTSKHFYDTTAQQYVKENAFDLGANVVNGLFADMDDLTKEEGRKQAEQWFRQLVFLHENGLFERAPRPHPAFTPVPCPAAELSEEEKPGDIVVVADMGEEDANLRAMVERFRAVCPKKTRLINIREFPFKGGCMGCFRCAADGKCFYTDNFADMLRNEIHTAEAVVLAFTVCDHSMGTRFKTYDDRQFCNGHRTVTMGTPFAYLVSGPLAREKNLMEVITARAEVGGNFLAGIATDERDPAGEIAALAKKLCYAVDEKVVLPKNFYGVGGMRIFRDLIWLMRGMMREDHRFFKAHGQYDFPQKQRGTVLKMYLVGMLLNNKTLMKKAGGKMTEGMLGPYKKFVGDERFE
ncbi:MAG: NAD(P)H-dependent oxidoreductase [Clostridia bacterium]|nr:NAD(P)H-dependent oxidoreductase [Clostridia bacterium]